MPLVPLAHGFPPRVGYRGSPLRWHGTGTRGDIRQCSVRIRVVEQSTEQQSAEVFRSTDEGWGRFRIYGPGEEVELASIGVHFPVSALYRHMDVPRTA